jgi:hypothetical protein
MAKLTTPWFRVVLDDDTEHTVRANNIDLLAYDVERTRRPDWPNPEQGPVFAQTYYAWHALKRVDAIGAMTFTEFQTHALQVEGITDEDHKEEVDPTQQAAGPE